MIELLSPAKNAEIGIAAISHGADAVYIGAPKFGARSAAGNTIQDIESLVKYAHLYRAKVYVALNTIIKDGDLEDAQRMIHELYNIGVDAIIVQDMGLLMLDLPPISLHASTQCDTRTLEKVLFLEKCGFEQVVLARETSLSDMREIASKTNVALETFIHGSLCVSYSGQCYLSHEQTKRSANRGQCAQMCRLPYSLLDANGTVIEKNRHLLSLKDLDASPMLREMIDAGIQSFKIEGRLKDAAYVKNITAYYRRKIDKILEGTDRRPQSLGKTTFSFEPDPKKTFFRGSTTYFLQERNKNIVSFDTPKSMGEPVGTVRDVWRNALTVNSQAEFSNGDGLCYLDPKREFQGFRVNKVEGGRLFPLNMPNIEKGTPLLRNHNAAFDKILNGNTSERLISLDITLREKGESFELIATDEDSNEVTMLVDFERQEAQNVEKAMTNIFTQLSKLGGTCFYQRNIKVDFQTAWFLPASLVGQWRRELVERLVDERTKNYKRSYRPIAKDSTHEYITKTVDYRANVYNQKAVEFYSQHGATVEQMAFETQTVDDAELMRCKHCIKYSVGACPKEPNSIKHEEPLYLENSRGRYALHFDCSACEMVVKQALLAKTAATI